MENGQYKALEEETISKFSFVDIIIQEEKNFYVFV